MKKYTEELEAGVSALRKATRICRMVRDRFVQKDSFQKADRTPVTIADFASQAVITAEILKRFPDDFIVGEEGAGMIRQKKGIRDAVLSILQGEMESLSPFHVCDLIDYGRRPFHPEKRFWALDPIDGTKGYIAGRGYAVALALVEEKEVVLGLLSCPELKKPRDADDEGDCILYAVRNEAAWTVIGENGKAEKIIRGERILSAAARLCESMEPSHADHEAHAQILEQLGSRAPSLRMDSQAKYGAVALGYADIYLRIPRKNNYREKIWDHAAGSLIVQEAGGKVTDLLGRPLDFSKGETLAENQGVIASTGEIHREVLAAVERTLRLC